MAIVPKTAGPLTLGKEIQVMDITATEAGTQTAKFAIDAESVLFSLYVGTVSGDVNVTVYTYGLDGHEVPIIEFPTVSAPTTELLLRKAASALQLIKVVVTYTDACTFNLRARGASAEAASFQILSANTFRASQKDVTTTAGTLIAAALSDRNGVLITNNNVGGNEILYLGGSLLEATTGVGTPIRPGGNITLDIAAGAEIYAVADNGTIDVRISETGG